MAHKLNLNALEDRAAQFFHAIITNAEPNALDTAQKIKMAVDDAYELAEAFLTHKNSVAAAKGRETGSEPATSE